MPYIIVENPGSYRLFHNTNVMKLTVPLKFSLGKSKEFFSMVKEVYSSYAAAEKDLRILEKKFPERSFGIKKTDAPVRPKKTYLVKLNWHGGIHTYETSAVSLAEAKSNVFNRLSRDIKMSPGTIRAYYGDRPLSIQIDEVK